MSSRYARTSAAILLAASLTLSLGCDEEKKDTTATATGSEESGASAKVDEARDAVAEVEEAAKFDKAMQKKACDILTPAMVSEAFGVPEEKLQQQKVLGCNYSWEGDGEILEARFGSIRVHDSTEVAQKWFKNATKGMTDEEVKAAMAKITERAKKDERVDTASKKEATEKLGGALGGMGGFQFEDVADVADEARASTADGELWVRLGNMTFTISAYKGAEMPSIKPPTDPGAMKDFSKKIMAATREWEKKTAPQRKEAAQKLAKLVIAKL